MPSAAGLSSSGLPSSSAARIDVGAVIVVEIIEHAFQMHPDFALLAIDAFPAFVDRLQMLSPVVIRETYARNLRGRVHREGDDREFPEAVGRGRCWTLADAGLVAASGIEPPTYGL
jgi:hypothetical protein